MLLQSYANTEEESPKDAYYMPAQADRCAPAFCLYCSSSHRMCEDQGDTSENAVLQLEYHLQICQQKLALMCTKTHPAELAWAACKLSRIRVYHHEYADATEEAREVI